MLLNLQGRIAFIFKIGFLIFNLILTERSRSDLVCGFKAGVRHVEDEQVIFRAGEAVSFSVDRNPAREKGMSAPRITVFYATVSIRSPSRVITADRAVKCAPPQTNVRR